MMSRIDSKFPITRQTFCVIVVSCAIAILGTTGCTIQSKSSTKNGNHHSSGDEIETVPAPAIASAEGSSADNSPLKFQTVILQENLKHPWGLAWLPDGSILITERPGRLRIVRNGVLDPKPIPGLPQVFAQSQGGLLDIAIHPHFQDNRLVYFTYSQGNATANRPHIARATFDGDSLKDWQVIFQVSQTKPRGQHFGSRLAWLPDGTLLASIGDGGNPPIELEGEFIRQQAQNLGSHLGKIIRIKDDGSIPSDNPFLNNTEAAPEVWS